MAGELPRMGSGGKRGAGPPQMFASDGQMCIKSVHTRRHTSEGYVNKSVTSHVRLAAGSQGGGGAGGTNEQDFCAGMRWSARHPEPKHKFPPFYGCEGPWMECVRRVTPAAQAGHFRPRCLPICPPEPPPTSSGARGGEEGASAGGGGPVFKPEVASKQADRFPAQRAGGSGPTEGTNWLSKCEYAVYQELNTLRTEPKTYAVRISERLPFLKGRTFWLPHRNGRGITTQEGRMACEEAVDVLMEMQPTLPLVDSPRGMSLAAVDHVRDTGPKGIVGHTGSDDSHIDSRLGRYGKWRGRCSEVVVYGMNHPIDVVVAAVVDDSTPDRHHRQELLSPHNSVCGIAWGPHALYETVCVLTLAHGFHGHPMEDQRRIHMDLETKFLPRSLPTCCGACGKPVTGPGIYALGHLWHSRCFTCRICGSQLKEYTTIASHIPALYPWNVEREGLPDTPEEVAPRLRGTETNLLHIRENSDPPPTPDDGSGQDQTVRNSQGKQVAVPEKVDPDGVYCRNCMERFCSPSCQGCGKRAKRIQGCVGGLAYCHDCLPLL